MCNHWLVDILQTRAVKCWLLLIIQLYVPHCKKIYHIKTFSTSHVNWWTLTWWVTFLGGEKKDQKQIWSQMLIHQETLSPASFGMNGFLLKWLHFKTHFIIFHVYSWLSMRRFKAVFVRPCERMTLWVREWQKVQWLNGELKATIFFAACEREGKGEREGGTGGFRGGGLVLAAAGSEDTTNLFDTSTILRLRASCLASPERGAGRGDRVWVTAGVSVRWDSCESIGNWDVCSDSTFLASFDEWASKRSWVGASVHRTAGPRLDCDLLSLWST